MIDPKAAKVRVHIDLFAFVLATLAIGWLAFNASAAWRLDLWVQMVVVLLVALVWTLIGYIVMNQIQKVIVRLIAAEAEKRHSRGSSS